MIQAMKNLNLLQKDSVIDSETAEDKYNKNISIKLEKVLNQVFVIILMHIFQLQEI